MDITAMQHRKSIVKEIRYSFFRGIILFILSSFMNLFAYDTTSYKIKDLHTKQPHETLQLALQDFIDSIKNISNNTKQPLKVIQKLADVPKDKAIKVINHQGYTYCYRPTFIANESYITLDYCKYQTKARYDVLKRISMHVGGETWLCLSAPYSVLNGILAIISATPMSGIHGLKPLLILMIVTSWLYMTFSLNGTFMSLSFLKFPVISNCGTMSTAYVVFMTTSISIYIICV